MAGKKGGGGKPSGGGRQTSDRVSRIASKGLRGEKLKPGEVRSLAGSVLSQDETRGPRKGK